jgi:hypothetical protein
MLGARRAHWDFRGSPGAAWQLGYIGRALWRKGDDRLWHETCRDVRSKSAIEATRTLQRKASKGRVRPPLRS